MCGTGPGRAGALGFEVGQSALLLACGLGLAEQRRYELPSLRADAAARDRVVRRSLSSDRRRAAPGEIYYRWRSAGGRPGWRGGRDACVRRRVSCLRAGGVARPGAMSAVTPADTRSSLFGAFARVPPGCAVLIWDGAGSHGEDVVVPAVS